MKTLTPFVRQYLETALWSSIECDENGDDCRPMDENYTVSDFTPEAIEQAKADCEAFCESAGDLLDDIDAEQAGHDFWLTRNHHGAGFWDRGLGEIGTKLTEIADGFGPTDAMPDGDGGVYLS